jgi:actin-related protein 6
VLCNCHCACARSHFPVHCPHCDLCALLQVELGLAAASIVLTGGNANLPGYRERFERELRPFVPDVYAVNVYQPAKPEVYAWQGAARFARQCGADRAMKAANFVTKAEYQEYGHEYTNEKFARAWK